ncbi:transposase [Bacillus alkalicola]|nr:transposase [Bacillus alkalicola]
MVLLQRKWGRLCLIYHIIALLSILIFGNIAAIAIYSILRDNTVFMTNIHGIFLNPFFLISGVYIGIYIVYFVMKAISISWKQQI